MNEIVNLQKVPVNPLVVGKIGRAYGFRGWVKIISFTDKVDNIFNYVPWFILLKSHWKLMTLDSWKMVGKHYIAKITNISDRECAISLSQSRLIIDSSLLPKLNNDEYYWEDIIGCQVMTVIGIYIGCVIRIIETPAHDILVVRLDENNFINTKDCLIPFVDKKIIKSIDLIMNLIIVDWNI